MRAGRAPDELAAEERAWAVVRAAYAELAPMHRRRRRHQFALIPAVIALVGVLALSPAGASVRRWISGTLAIPHAAPRLFSLPSRGSLLVSGPGGTWTIAADGSARRLGVWRQASWSPHGRFMAVIARGELAAIDPRGHLRWELARPGAADASWYAPSGFRIAYLSGTSVRVVAGDGTGDHLLSANVAPVTPAWRANHAYQLAYVTQAGQIVVRQADTGQMIWTARPRAHAQEISWSTNGTRLLVITRSSALVYDPAGRLVASIHSPQNAPIQGGTLSPSGRTIALVRGGAQGDVVFADLAARTPRLQHVLSVNGVRELAWSPDGRWLVMSWPPADEWVFVGVPGQPRIEAVSRIAQKLGQKPIAQAFPRIDGWCCARVG